MRPLALTIEGLRSFRAPVTIDFTGRDQVAIVGDTGAGKSSILEAMTYALYGETTFAAQVNQELMNDTSTTLRVVFRFRVSGEEWEVARVLKKAGGGKVGGAKAQLRCIDRDGRTTELIGLVKPVNSRIEKLIGLDSAAFLRTVILPQGRFSRLLVEDKPAARAVILQQVWPMDDLMAAATGAGAARERATHLRVQLEQAVSEYPTDPRAHLAQLIVAHECAREEARAAAATADKAEAAYETYQDAQVARETAAAVLERLHAPVIDNAAEQMEPLTAREREIETKDAALVRRLEAAATRLAEVPEDTDGPAVSVVASALATLPAIGPLVAAAETAADEARRSADIMRQAVEDARRTSELAAFAAEQVARHAERRPALAATAADARDRRANLEQRYADCQARKDDLEHQQAALAELRNRRMGCAAQLDKATAEARRAETAATEARLRLQAAEGASVTRAATYAEEKQRLLEVRQVAEKRLLTLGQGYDMCLTNEHAVKQARRKRAQHQEHLDALKRRLETANGAAREARHRRREADEQVVAAQRSDSAAAASRDLHPGDACPVCFRDLPSGWTAPASASLREALETARSATQAADAVGNRVVALTTERRGVEQLVDEAVIQADGAEEAFRLALKALGDNAGIDLPGTLPDRNALLDPLDTALQAASDAADRYERDHAVQVETLAHRQQLARDKWEASQRDSVTAGQRVAAITAELQGLEQQLEGAENGAAAATDALTASFHALGDAAGVALADVLPGRDALLEPFEAAVQEGSDALARHDAKHETLQSQSNQRSNAAAAAAGAAAGAQALANAKRNAAAKALAQLHGAIEAVPATFRPSLDLAADPSSLQQVDTTAIEERRASAKEREQLLAARAAKRQRLQREIAAAQEERGALARRKTVLVSEPIKGIVHALNEHRSVLMKAVWDLDLDESVPATAVPVDTDALQSLLEALRTTSRNVAQAASEHAAAAVARADTSRSELTAVAARLAGDVDFDQLDLIVKTARTAANEVGFKELQREKETSRFAGIVDDVQQLRALFKKAVDKEQALTDLENALKPGAFPKWLTLRRSRDLLVHASRMLGKMSGGRYAFVDPQDTDAQWRVLDRDSNQPRSPASLSGGEQFIASLSLALGMVEMMARSGGRLESLFLDEGFGSLDRNNLDAAVQALGTVAARGRMVGVISHVRAVAEQIDHVLAVTRDATGSRVEWLTSRQRRHLSESDTGLEAASALAGLLE